MKREALYVCSLPGYEEEIGRWLWCLEDVRHALLAKVTGISQRMLDTKGEGGHSIGSLLYHIALIEADWLYAEVLEREWDPEIRSLFPFDVRSEDGSLAHIEGESLEEHVYRLNKVREIFLSHFRYMDTKDWRRPRTLERYDVTPEWVVYHLIEHESSHRGQIFQLLSTLRDD